MQLNELGHQVMAVDKDEERVNECMPFVTNAQIGDSTRVDFLRSLGVSNYDVCYVTISGDFQNSLETTSLLKELGANYVVSRAERDVQAKFLLRNGADAVAYPEKQLAKWAAIRYTANHIFSYIELDEQHAIIEVAVPEDWQGRSIGELEIRRLFIKSPSPVPFSNIPNRRDGPAAAYEPGTASTTWRGNVCTGFCLFWPDCSR